MAGTSAAEAQRAAEENGRVRSGAYSAIKTLIANLSDDEIRDAAQWPRLAEAWKQQLLDQEKQRRGI